jgi:hypothetical protein
MVKTDTRCSHTCRALCTALEIALLHEKQAILQFDALRDQCTYPEVQTVLAELVRERQKTMTLLEDAKNLLRSKFDVLDQVRAGFESDR